MERLPSLQNKINYIKKNTHYFTSKQNCGTIAQAIVHIQNIQKYTKLNSPYAGTKGAVKVAKTKLCNAFQQP